MNMQANQLNLFSQSISWEMFQNTHKLLLNNMKGPLLVGNKGQPTVYLFLVHPVYMYVCECMCINLWVNVTHLGIFFFFAADIGVWANI